MSTLIFTNAEEAFSNYPRGRVPSLDVLFLPELLDILQLVSHGGKKLGLVSMTDGFAWFRLEAVVDAVPEIWDAYLAWYLHEFNVDPLSVLEDDVPSPTRNPPCARSPEFDDSANTAAVLSPASPYEKKV